MKEAGFTETRAKRLEPGVSFNTIQPFTPELEIRFSPEGASTLVDLEHRLLHYYGDKAVEMRGIFDSEQGWMGLLNAFAARASAS
jgi:hypothetical protein